MLFRSSALRACGLGADAVARLAALTLESPQGASHLAAHLRLSNSQADALGAAARRHPSYDPQTSEADARRWLYKQGRENFLRAAIVSWASSAAATGDEARKDRAFLAHRWTIPAMPVRGADVLALGVGAGPEVGRVLAAFEEWWMSADFPSDAATHKRTLQALVADRY